MAKKVGLSLLLAIIVAFGVMLFFPHILGCATTQTASTTTTTTIVHGGPTVISQSITVNTTWSLSGSPYVISADVSVSKGVALTIEAGVAVKFRQGFTLTVNGKINAAGSASLPVYITAYTDDSYAGDTDGDGGANLPTRGYWGSVHIFDAQKDQPQSNISYCVVKYGGAGSAPKANLKIYQNNANISNCRIASSEGDGIAILSDADMTIASNVIDGNDWAMNWSENNSSIQFSANSISNNTHNGIRIGWTEVAANSTMVLNNAGVPYVILASNFSSTRRFSIKNGAKLTLDPGVILKLDQNVEISVGDLTETGELYAVGTASIPIYITSYYDDLVGGDTAASSIDPTANNYAYAWSTIYLWRRSDLQYCKIGLGGNGNSTRSEEARTLLNISSPSTIQSCTFDYAFYWVATFDYRNGANLDAGRTIADMQTDKTNFIANNTIGSHFGSSESVSVLP